MKHTLPLALLLASLSTGCSTIVSKSDYAVAINSQPEGAEFTIVNRNGENVHQGMTPSTVTLSASSGYFKGETYTIELNKQGYAPQSFTLKSGVDGWYFGNLVFGGLIGMLIVDPATGAMYNLPERVDVSLDQSITSNTGESLKIGTIGALTPEQIKRLEPIK